MMLFGWGGRLQLRNVVKIIGVHRMLSGSKVLSMRSTCLLFRHCGAETKGGGWSGSRQQDKPNR